MVVKGATIGVARDVVRIGSLVQSKSDVGVVSSIWPLVT